MQLLKQSTAATVLIGPAVDKTDGFTPEPDVATSPDEVVVYKSDGTVAVDISGTASLTHRAGGMYTAVVSTSNTDTLGRFVVYVRKDADCRPIRTEFTILPAVVYDSLVGGSDKLQVDAVQFLGSAVTLSVGNLPDVNVKEISDDETAADTLESYTDGNANMPVDMVKISSSATGANNLELYTTGADRMPVHLQEVESSLDFSATMKTALETAVANKLDAAIPGSPTANSINQRIGAMDDLIQASGAGDLAAIKTILDTTGVQLDLTQSLDETPTATTVGAGLYFVLASVRHKVGRASSSSLAVITYQADGATPSYTRNLNAATNPIAITPA